MARHGGWLVFWVVHCLATARAQTPWLVGNDFVKKLSQPMAITWSEVPYRQALRELSQSQRVAVVLDRRVDPDRPINLAISDQSLLNVLQAAARERGMEASVLDGVVYLGPPAVARNLRTLIAVRERQLQRLPAAGRTAWLATASLGWSDGATPRDILDRLCQSAGIRLLDVDSRIGHDVWAGAELPALSLLQRLSLVLAQFDLTFDIENDPRVARLAPFPDECTIQRRYRLGSAANQVARQWAQIVPEARIRVEGGTIVVDARLEDHERLSGKAKASPAPLGEDIEKVRIDSLTLEQLPLGRVLESFAQRVGLRLELDRSAIRAAGIDLEQPITVKIQKASVNEALGAILEPASLRFERQGRRVKVFPGANR